METKKIETHLALVVTWAHNHLQRFGVEGLDVLQRITGEHRGLGEPDLDGRLDVTARAASITLVVARAGALAGWTVSVFMFSVNALAQACNRTQGHTLELLCKQTLAWLPLPKHNLQGV